MKDTQITDIFSELIEDLNSVSQTDIFKNSVDSLKGLQKQVGNTNKMMTDLARKNDLRGVKMLKESADRVRQSQVEAAKELMKAKEDLLKIDQESNKKAYQAQIKNIKRLNSQLNQLSKESVQMQKNAGKFAQGLEHNLTQYENLLRNREERIAELGKAGQIMEEKFAKRFESSVDVFTSGVSDLESVGKTFTSGLDTFRGYLSERAGKAMDKAKAGKGSAGVANLLGGLSKTVGMLAVAAGSVMALVSLFKMAEESVIGANKELVNGAGLTDMMAAGMGDTGKNLELVRNTFRSADFATEMGMAVNETIELVNSFNDLNMGIRQFGGGEEGMEKMKEAMKNAKGMAMGLGISMDEASQYMSKFAFDLGVSVKDGAILSRMAGDFADIRDMALQSSYSTANFFKKVVELTDQLDNMNYRTKEAGALMVRFAKVLGKSGLDAAMQQLFSGFRGEGYLDQLQRNMLTKSEELRKATEVEALRFGKVFSDTFGGVGGQSDAFKSLQKSIGNIKTDAEGNVDTADLVKRLSTMSERQRQDTMAQLAKDGVSGEFRDQLFSFMRLAAGTKKKATAAERQAAQEEMGAGGNLKSKFAIVESYVGDKNINDLGVITKEALGKFGVGKEQLEIFAKLQTGLKGQMRMAQDIASGKITDFSSFKVKDEKTGKMRAATSKEEALASMNAGVALNEDGKLVIKDTGTIIKNFSDFLQAQGADLDKKLGIEEQKTQEQILAEGVQATTSVFNALNNTIAEILNDISAGIYSMVTYFFGKKETPAEKAAKKQLVGQIQDQIAQLQANQRGDLGKKAKLEKEIASLSLSKDPQKKKEVEAKQRELKQLDETMKADLELAKAKKEQMHILQSTTYDSDKTWGIDADYNMAQLERMSAEELAKRKAKRGAKTGLGSGLAKYKEDEKQALKGFEEIVASHGGSADMKGIMRFLAGEYNIRGRGAMSAEQKVKQDTELDAKRDELLTHLVKLGYTLDSKVTGKGKGDAKYMRHELRNKDGEVMGGIDTTYSASKHQAREKRKREGKSKTLLGASLGLSGHTFLGKAQDGLGGFKSAYGKEGSRLNDEVAKLNKEPKARTAIKQEAVEAEKATRKQVIENQTDAVMKGMEKYEEKARLDKLKEVAKALGITPNDKDTLASLSRKVAGVDMKTLDAGRKSKLTRSALGGNEIARSLLTPKEGADILVTDSGEVWKIDRQDKITPMASGGYSMSKPGGEIDKYIGKRMGAGGGGGRPINITVNVNGGNTNEQTGMVVATAISDTIKGFMGDVG